MDEKQKAEMLLKNLLTSVTASSKVSMTTATFIRPDTHLIFLAGEVAFTESLGKEELNTLFNWYNELYDVYL